jgi:hypothetical protein
MHRKNRELFKGVFMKTIVAVLSLIFVQSAFAIDFECEDKATNRTSFISSWPNLVMSIAESGRVDYIASWQGVCYSTMNSEKQCTISENPTMIEVDCSSKGVFARFELDNSGLGSLSCSIEGVVRKTWKLGNCHEKN